MESRVDLSRRHAVHVPSWSGLSSACPALRLKGLYLALVTLAIAYVLFDGRCPVHRPEVRHSVTGGSQALIKGIRYQARRPWTGLKGNREDRDAALQVLADDRCSLAVGYVIARNLRQEPHRPGHGGHPGQRSRQRQVMGINLALVEDA